MAYPHLLALIDDKIARLRLARELLSSPELVLPELYSDPTPHEERMRDEQPALAGADLNAFPDAFPDVFPDPYPDTFSAAFAVNGNGRPALTGQQQAAASVAQPVQRVRGFQRRERRTVRRPAPVEPSALRSTRPAGPVFVPASRVQADAVAAAALDETIPKPLDAAALARRWLSNSN